MKNSGVLQDTTELRRLLLEHPDLPIAILCDADVNTGDYSWMYAPGIRFNLGEILDCDQDIDECKVYYDRSDFEEDVINLLADDPDIPEYKFDAEVQKELAKYEPYWKDCIFIWAGI